MAARRARLTAMRRVSKIYICTKAAWWCGGGGGLLEL